MLLIGLTGSIATGKSTVSTLLSAPPYSLPVIDADLLARQVVEPGTPAYGKVVAYFGPTTPDLLQEASEPGGRRPLNRAALGRRVFGDDPERRRDRAVLNGIVHPAVRAAMYRMMVRCYVTGCWAVVLDVPLLFESRLDVLCGTVMVVAVRDQAVQMARLRARDPHLTAEDATNRVRSQGDVRDKARRCVARDGSASASGTATAGAKPPRRDVARGIVLWNDGDREELERQVAAAVERLRAASPPWWHHALLLCPPLGLAAAAWTYWQNVRINRRWQAEEQRTRANL
ncbi:dephospho-kinase [Grosmannia clavigera kw1407]|uniref:Dephospho-kinase n=1 Tax=Grosmannia clavigera (strain kw1407 / UAMH 11150) TaxID=655863 RepID=F0XC58_GROCL|nr:dephospho-kinase [Grosmannia clavigera kw1407]EFX04274.1 dephospho-kinase [Grosmannia clavigera kw1407]